MSIEIEVIFRKSMDLVMRSVGYLKKYKKIIIINISKNADIF